MAGLNKAMWGVQSDEGEHLGHLKLFCPIKHFHSCCVSFSSTVPHQAFLKYGDSARGLEGDGDTGSDCTIVYHHRNPSQPAVCTTAMHLNAHKWLAPMHFLAFSGCIVSVHCQEERCILFYIPDNQKFFRGP